VDVVIRLDSIYYYDVSALNVQGLAAFNAVFIPATYPYADYKAHVVAALQKSFGAADVKPTKKRSRSKPTAADAAPMLRSPLNFGATFRDS
jgi:hypothetical protein